LIKEARGSQMYCQWNYTLHVRGNKAWPVRTVKVTELYSSIDKGISCYEVFKISFGFRK